MTQINSIKLGVIVMCVATVPLTLAQTPRIGTSGSKQSGATTGNSTRATQTVRAHPGTNAGAQTGITNQAIGITGAAPGLSGSSGTSTWSYTDWGKGPGGHEYNDEHERRSTHWRRRCDAYQRNYFSSTIHPFAHFPRSKFLDGGRVPVAATIGLGHPNSNSDSDSQSLIDR